MCSSYVNVLYSDINLTILDFLHAVEIAFFLVFFSSYNMCLMCFSFLADLYFTSILKMLNVLTACMAPQGPMVISGS